MTKYIYHCDCSGKMKPTPEQTDICAKCNHYTFISDKERILRFNPNKKFIAYSGYKRKDGRNTINEDWIAQ